MWIKHNNALYNSNDISKIHVSRTAIKAKFKDGTEEIIGSFRTAEEAGHILHSITQSLLFEDKDHPGIIIRDTKEKKGGKESNS